MDPIEEVVKQLKELNTTNKRLLEIQGLDYALDPLGYITRKLRSGEALPSIAAYYQVIVPAGMFSITFLNPSGYVWIGVHQSVVVSQSAVFELTAMVDDGILPALYIPRLTSHEVSWTVTLPFGNIIKNSTTIIYVNHDIANQWISVISIGAYLRKDVWEKDSKLMDEVAERYLHPAPLPQYRR